MVWATRNRKTEALLTSPPKVETTGAIVGIMNYVVSG
jgi:hypothetical protein